jgi:hypothetical protein
MELGARLRFRLEPRDEYPHSIDPAENFNESMYVNLFDFDEEMGAWFRVGNRPNEGYTEVTCCLYLPDGRVGFIFHRPKNTRNDGFTAGGLTIEVTEPFGRLGVRYEGTVCVLKDPFEMADPRKAFAENPHLPCRVELAYRGVAPMFGGQPIADDGTPVEEKPEEGFARAHYEQHMAGQGTVRVGDQQWSISGLGLRDHSWGPRYWQNIHWYRWLPMSFSEEFAMMISIIAMADGRRKVGGIVLEGGQYHLIEEAHLTVDYDQNRCQAGITATVKTGSKSYHVEGSVLSLIPLRNRRTTTDGRQLVTRIAEGMTRYTCDGRVGYGMSEFLDQIVDGEPVGP